MGRPLPGYRVELLDAEGQPASEGEICVDLSADPRGLMLGYAGEAGANAAVRRGGWYHTGDVAARDEDGYITYVGRSDDVFKASDYRISPFELESVLIRHPAVAEAAVVPSPDPMRWPCRRRSSRWPRDTRPARKWRAASSVFVKENLAPYKRIRRLEFCELPKTVSGKIRRAQLRKEEHARPPRRDRREREFFE